MDCEQARGLLDAYLDSELERSPGRNLEEHLSLCPSCWSLAQERQELRIFFKAIALTDKAPSQLRTKVLAAVRREKAEQTFAFLRRPGVYAAALFVLGLSLALNILFPDVGKEVSRQAVFLHSRSISTDHLVDVTSANPKIVKSWLTAKLNFSPPVVGFPSPEYSLLGGRADVIQGRPVATVVYKKANDVITLFCWPPKKDHLAQGDHFVEGYHVCAWSNAECNYILVSKLGGGEIDKFVDSFQDQAQSGAFY